MDNFEKKLDGNKNYSDNMDDIITRYNNRVGNIAMYDSIYDSNRNYDGDIHQYMNGKGEDLN